MPFKDEYIVPLSQHIGAPAKVIVRPGQKVFRGQMIAAPGGFVSVAHHAPVTGKVKDIELKRYPGGAVKEAIVIERDRSSGQTLYNERRIDWQSLPAPDMLKLLQESGFVGLGGAAFPTHVKMSIPDGKKASIFLVNGCECEPYLTCDHRVMVESADEIYQGIRICMKLLGTTHAYIGVEQNKPDAISTLKEKMPGDFGAGSLNSGGMTCEVVGLETKYPQGAEKMLITAVFQKEVPRGKLPIDLSIVVNNISTIKAMADLVNYGMPLIERVVTVTGPGINRPSNILVPIGTKLGDVIELCGGLKDTCRQVLLGGPMMGASQAALDLPVTKGTSGILCLTEDELVVRDEHPCIRCLSCVDACPVFLNPCRLGLLARHRDYHEMMNYDVLDCMECAACSYVCPSNIPLVQQFRVAKAVLREEKAREQAEKANV
jgi:electron transport complex protein RnfC